MRGGGGKVARHQAAVVVAKKSRGWPGARDNRDFRDERDRDDRAKRDERDGMGHCSTVSAGKCVEGMRFRASIKPRPPCAWKSPLLCLFFRACHLEEQS